MEIAAYLDSTDLRPEAGKKDIKALCAEAVYYQVAAVCIHPYRLPLARKILTGSGVRLGTVIGFPLGADGRSAKLYSARMALDHGAQELDMVINIGAVKDHNLAVVEEEICSILELKRDYQFALKVIIETALLTMGELVALTKLISGTNADYIKTSTGFSSRGVTLEDIRIIRLNKSPELRIKAAGGIRKLDFALELIQAGVDRLGTSSAVAIIKEANSRGGT